MKIKDIQYLIDNKLQPNVAEWTMDVEDVLLEMDMLSDDTKSLLKSIRQQSISWHNSFPEKSDTIVAILKRALRKIEKSSDKKIKGEDVVMTSKNVFIVYSHQSESVMLKIKDFIEKNLGLCPKTLDISEYTGSVWDAFSKNVADCQKAVVLMSGDDSVTDTHGNTYKQARPNVFIELGYLIHKCGLKNVTIVYSDDCKEPSDIGNLVSVHYGSEMWTESFRKQLNR